MDTFIQRFKRAVRGLLTWGHRVPSRIERNTEQIWYTERQLMIDHLRVVGVALGMTKQVMDIVFRLYPERVSYDEALNALCELETLVRAKPCLLRGKQALEAIEQVRRRILRIRPCA